MLKFVIAVLVYLIFLWLAGLLFEFVEGKVKARRKRREREKREREKREQIEVNARKPLTGYRQHLPALIEAQCGRCGICGEALPDDWQLIHVDHITPQSRGGTDALDNLQAAHEVCNLRKGPRTMDELPPDLFSQPVKYRFRSI